LTLEEDMDHTPTIRRLYDLINAGDIDGLGHQFADDFTEHEDLPGFPPNKTGAIKYFQMLIAAFPDIRMVPEDVIASGDTAVARSRMTGTHKGPFMGMDATGKRIEVKLIDIIRFGDDGRARISVS
jgi:ketosteroid isomerase-like protein